MAATSSGKNASQLETIFVVVLLLLPLLMRANMCLPCHLEVKLTINKKSTLIDQSSNRNQHEHHQINSQLFCNIDAEILPRRNAPHLR